MTALFSDTAVHHIADFLLRASDVFLTPLPLASTDPWFGRGGNGGYTSGVSAFVCVLVCVYVCVWCVSVCLRVCV